MNRVDCDTEAVVDLSLGHGDKLARACANLEDTLARTKVGQSESVVAVWTKEGVDRVVDADHVAVRLVELVGSGVVDHDEEEDVEDRVKVMLLLR